MDATIESIAAGGSGVARVHGLVTFVPRTAPGDRALVRVQPRGRFARGELLELHVPSPDRVAPPCPHYEADRCGGCQLQHIAYDAQRDAKGRIIGDALTRIGGHPVTDVPVESSPARWRYRRTLTLALRRRGATWIAGLHRYDDPDAVFDLADCPITDQRVVRVWREVMGSSDLLPDERALRGSVRLLNESVSLVLEGGRDWPRSAEFFARVASLTALWWTRAGGARALLHDRRAAAEPGASFVQVNPDVAIALRAHVTGAVRAHGPASVVDAYAGAGDTAARLADGGVRVTAIEIDADAAAWAAARLSPPSRVVVGAVEHELHRVLPADVVVLNPPRGGVDERVTAALRAVPPRAVVYVSCDPATLARDVARLPGFRVAAIRGFDMFPQTAHVETVCELVPAA